MPHQKRHATYTFGLRTQPPIDTGPFFVPRLPPYLHPRDAATVDRLQSEAARLLHEATKRYREAQVILDAAYDRLFKR